MSDFSKYHHQIPSVDFYLTKDQTLEIIEAFEIFDIDKSGFIDRHELRVALGAMGFETPKDEIMNIMNRYDPENTGEITFQDFYKIVGEKISKRRPQDELHKLFLLFADRKLMRIGIHNLRDVFKQINENVDDETLEQMIADFDGDHDGFITESEFINILHPGPFPEDQGLE
ncbi:Centrin-3 [Tritrichomonas musculus]|uniref:Centrin-3 n=1 Tax=Tritrichomonas musculus TaxID=1915356 RepID=A0ABR2LAG5_9EUKA